MQYILHEQLFYYSETKVDGIIQMFSDDMVHVHVHASLGSFSIFDGTIRWTFTFVKPPQLY